MRGAIANNNNNNPIAEKRKRKVKAPGEKAPEKKRRVERDINAELIERRRSHISGLRRLGRPIITGNLDDENLNTTAVSSIVDSDSFDSKKISRANTPNNTQLESTATLTLALSSLITTSAVTQSNNNQSLSSSSSQQQPMQSFTPFYYDNYASLPLPLFFPQNNAYFPFQQQPAGLFPCYGYNDYGYHGIECSSLLPIVGNAGVLPSGEPSSSISSASVMPTLLNNNSFFAPAALEVSPQPTKTMPVSTTSSLSPNVLLAAGTDTESNSFSSSSVTPLLPLPPDGANDANDDGVPQLEPTVDIAIAADTPSNADANAAALPTYSNDSDDNSAPLSPGSLQQLSNAEVAFFFPQSTQLLNTQIAADADRKPNQQDSIFSPLELR